MIKRLGAIRLPKDKSAYGMFECPVCGEEYVTRISSVKNGSSSKCKKCSCNKPKRTIREIVSYNKDTGEFTRKYRTSNRVSVGDICNNINSDGYIHIMINKKNYLAHRLAWYFFYGYFPNGELDHINRVKTDNRISNLRLVTSSENSRNMPKTKRNKSGTVGVSWYKNRKKWRATIMNNNKQVHLGYYDDKDEAIRIRKYYEKEYRYHENHGIDTEEERVGSFGSTGK